MPHSDSSAALSSSGPAPNAPDTSLLTALPWGGLLLAPDGTVAQLNAVAETLWGVAAAAVLGHRPEAVQPAVLPAALLQALTQPPAESAEYWLPHTRQWISLRTAPAPDAHQWLFWDNITARKQTEQALHQSHELLQRTIDSSLDLVQVFEAVRDEQGTVVDFRWLLNNSAAERVYGDVIGQRLLRLNPGVVEEGIFDTFKQVLETGVPDQCERHYVHEQFDGWFFQSTVKLGDGVTTTTHDITARKRTEQELRDSKALLQDIIDAPHIGLAVYRAVRNAAGEIVDFTHDYSNRASRAMLGEDFTGRLFTDHGDNGRRQIPQLREVLETGRANSYLRAAEFRGRPVRLAITNTPLDGDRLVHTWEDVTERQQAEAEILRLLEQAEAVAGLGSWDYELTKRALRWSDGMYHLFGLPVGSPVAPSRYLEAVLDEDRPRAEQVVGRLTAGEGVEETLRLRVDGHVKTVRMKAVVLRDEAGQPVRVLGVDLDISELQRLEADNLRLRLTQQQALFEAVLEAQEAERKRIAEGLHNGVGQLLYATKLQLGQAQAAEPALKRTSELLADAIRQVRAISHELVPMVLTEFGLDIALQDICHKLGSWQLRFTCHIDLSELRQPLSQPLQVALYRMAQELGQNVVKHARATEASLTLEAVPGFVLLRVEDNGVGFAPGSNATAGMGLRSIRDRVELLGGNMETGSSPAVGTFARIRLPLPCPEAAASG